MALLAMEPLYGERLDPAELTAIALAFRHASDGWRHQVRFDEHEPFRVLLHADDRCDVWLSTWLPGQSSGWHRHHGSAVALAIAEGSLVEQRLNRFGRRVRRRHRHGTAVWMAPGTVHELQNRSRCAALSVHVYSPSLLRTQFSVSELADDVVDAHPATLAGAAILDLDLAVGKRLAHDDDRRHAEEVGVGELLPW